MVIHQAITDDQNQAPTTREIPTSDVVSMTSAFCEPTNISTKPTGEEGNLNTPPLGTLPTDLPCEVHVSNLLNQNTSHPLLLTSTTPTETTLNPIVILPNHFIPSTLIVNSLIQPQNPIPPSPPKEMVMTPNTVNFINSHANTLALSSTINQNLSTTITSTYTQHPTQSSSSKLSSHGSKSHSKKPCRREPPEPLQLDVHAQLCQNHPCFESEPHATTTEKFPQPNTTSDA